MATPPRHVKGGYVDPKKLPKGPNGRALCRQCQTETKPPRKTFCSDRCVELWMVRTGSRMAQFIKKRDKGVCAICRLDCEALKKSLKAMEKDLYLAPLYPTAEDYDADGVLLNENFRQRFNEHAVKRKEHRQRARAEIQAFKEKHGIPQHRSRFWDIDHIVPVVQGGGSSGPENLRTLCLACHRKVTAELAAKRAAARRAAKEPKD